MANKLRLVYLFKQLAENTISQEEHIELLNYILHIESDAEAYSAMDEVWEDLQVIESYTEVNKTDLYNKIIADHRFQVQEIANPIHVRKIKVAKLSYQIAVAAILVVFIGFTFFHYIAKEEIDNIQSATLVRADIPPGGNKAVLILSDGSIISLDDVKNGEITQQSGISISRMENGEIVYRMDNKQLKIDTPIFNTISTPRGGQYQIVLSDGTKVWLNAASSLHYPTQFNLEERRVELTGEAYFEVAKSTIPFFVYTANQKVEVLGTHFNVNSYPDEISTKTTLLEGSVRVIPISSSLDHDSAPSFHLRPGQQAVLQANNIKKIKADLEITMAWKSNDFVFEDEGIESIMRKISRWYDVDVEYTGKNNELRFGGIVSRRRNISAVLSMLESTGLVKFNIEGRRVIVRL